jgi:predicted metal-dependent peptidase
MAQPVDDARRLVSKAQLTVRTQAPFFAALALFAPVEITTTVPTAATDGRRLLVNPDFWHGLDAKERVGVLLHELLHAALLHVPRRGTRDPLLWNIAADIVVNGIVAQQRWCALPSGHIREENLEHLTVEEVYHCVRTDPSKRDLIAAVYAGMGDLLPPSAEVAGALGAEWRARLADYWAKALAHAQVVAQSLGHGTLPAGLPRELGAIGPARIDWRTHLWRFLVQTPTDFQGYDRRLIGRGYYLEALQGESVRVAVCVDTSGSIGGREIELFLSEVQGILGAYPLVECDLYYADAACHGPFALTASDAIPPPVGGGGTDFRPFFEKVQGADEANLPALCVYLTDGFGTFPEAPPALPVLWVITPGGLDLAQIPFGERVRLVEE